MANPRDALLYIRRLGAQEDLGALGPHDRPEGEQGAAVSIEALVNEHLSNNKLDLLPQLELGDAVRAFVDKDDNNSIKEYAGMPDSATLLSSLLRFIQRYLSVLRDSFSDTRILSDADIATLELKIRALAGKISREASKSARHGAEPLGLSASLSGGSPRKNASGESPAANVTGAYSRDSDNGRLGGEARVLGSSHVGRHPGPGNRWAPPSALRFSDRPPVDTGEDEVTFSTFRSSMANLGEQ